MSGGRLPPATTSHRHPRGATALPARYPTGWTRDPCRSAKRYGRSRSVPGQRSVRRNQRLRWRLSSVLLRSDLKHPMHRIGFAFEHEYAQIVAVLEYRFGIRDRRSAQPLQMRNAHVGEGLEFGDPVADPFARRKYLFELHIAGRIAPGGL